MWCHQDSVWICVLLKVLRCYHGCYCVKINTDNLSTENNETTSAITQRHNQEFWNGPRPWYQICSTETKPPVREARQEAEGQISGNMSDSLINIPARDSFSSSVNNWTPVGQTARKQNYWREFWVCPSSPLIMRQVKEEPVSFPSVFIQCRPLCSLTRRRKERVCVCVCAGKAETKRKTHVQV